MATASWRDLAVFTGGTAAGLMAGKLIAPLAAKKAGEAGATAGGDVFAELTADHQAVLALLDEMAQLGPDAPVKRTALFLKLKRDLSKHALSEEDVIYPLLRDRVNRRDAVTRLYNEHAEVKIALAELEELVPEGVRWNERVQSLRAMIAEHARDEEEHQFPALRNALDAQNRVMVSGKVSREKALLV